MYENNDCKFVAVLNRRHPIPILCNALGHLTAGLVGQGGSDDMRFLSYRNEAADLNSIISFYPYIVLSAKNSSQLRTLHLEAARQGLRHNLFVTAMIGASAEEQLRQTAGAEASALDYVAVALFGPAAALDPLTRKFSLLRADAAPERDAASAHGTKEVGHARIAS